MRNKFIYLDIALSPKRSEFANLDHFSIVSKELQHDKCDVLRKGSSLFRLHPGITLEDNRSSFSEHKKYFSWH